MRKNLDLIFKDEASIEVVEAYTYYEKGVNCKCWGLTISF